MAASTTSDQSYVRFATSKTGRSPFEASRDRLASPGIGPTSRLWTAFRCREQSRGGAYNPQPTVADVELVGRGHNRDQSVALASAYELGRGVRASLRRVVGAHDGGRLLLCRACARGRRAARRACYWERPG